MAFICFNRKISLWFVKPKKKVFVICKGISREDAFAFAEKFLLENGFLRED